MRSGSVWSGGNDEGDDAHTYSSLAAATSAALAAGGQELPGSPLPPGHTPLPPADAPGAEALSEAAVRAPSPSAGLSVSAPLPAARTLAGGADASPGLGDDVGTGASRVTVSGTQTHDAPASSAVPALASAPAAAAGSGAELATHGTATRSSTQARVAATLPAPVLRTRPSVGVAPPMLAGIIDSHHLTPRQARQFGRAPSQAAAAASSSRAAPSAAAGVDTGLDSWQLVRLENRLRIFADSSDTSGTPALKAIGVVPAPSGDVFSMVMDLGPARRLWDPSFQSGEVLERLDAHSDVVRVLLRPVFIWPVWTAERELVMIRYWRRDEDGVYTLVYRSTEHENAKRSSATGARGTPQPVRAVMLAGGFTIEPRYGFDAADDGSAVSVVTTMTQVDPKGWLYRSLGFLQPFALPLLLCVAGLRDTAEQYTLSGDDRASACRQLSLASAAAYAAAVASLGAAGFGATSVAASGSVDGAGNGSGCCIDGSVIAAPPQELMSPPVAEGVMCALVSGDCVAAEFEPAGAPADVAADAGDGASAGDDGDGASAGGPPDDQAGELVGAVDSIRHVRAVRDYPSKLKTWTAADPNNTWASPEAKLFQVRGAYYMSDNRKVESEPSALQLVALDLCQNSERVENVCARPGTVAHTARATGDPQVGSAVRLLPPPNTLDGAAITSGSSPNPPTSHLPPPSSSSFLLFISWSLGTSPYLHTLLSLSTCTLATAVTLRSTPYSSDF